MSTVVQANPTETFTRRSTFELYEAFIRNSFLKMLAYRLRYYTGIITYLLFVSVYYFIWSAVYASEMFYVVQYKM